MFKKTKILILIQVIIKWISNTHLNKKISEKLFITKKKNQLRVFLIYNNSNNNKWKDSREEKNFLMSNNKNKNLKVFFLLN